MTENRQGRLSGGRLVGLIAFGLVVGLWLWVSWHHGTVLRLEMARLFALDYTGPEKAGAPFGELEALFAGLAFAGLIVALVYQRSELAAQRGELQLQRQELAESVKAQRALVHQARAERSASQVVRVVDAYSAWLGAAREFYESPASITSVHRVSSRIGDATRTPRSRSRRLTKDCTPRINTPLTAASSSASKPIR